MYLFKSDVETGAFVPQEGTKLEILCKVNDVHMPMHACQNVLVPTIADYMYFCYEQIYM